jgi:cap2 methyltransferase
MQCGKFYEGCVSGADTTIQLGVSAYTVYDFDVIRGKLNSAKTLLDKYYLASGKVATSWSTYQYIIDLYKPLRAKISQISGAKYVTNAWMKYYEIYCKYAYILLKNRSNIRVFFNAELPGAALSAFNHYMKTVIRKDYQWRASSYYPRGSDTTAISDSTALGDRYGFYEKNRSNWLMGKTQNGGFRDGDMTNIDNILEYERLIGPNSEFGGVDLYSHDAGMDVGGSVNGELQFNQQETINMRLHLGCAIAGLYTLRQDGIFIAKQYTFFETLTWNLIIIYSTLFEQFYICKPKTSRVYNSEIYLIGIGYKGISTSVRAVLEDKLHNFNTLPVLSNDNVNITAISQIGSLIRCANDIFGTQTVAIHKNIDLFNKHKNNIKKYRESIQKSGIYTNCIQDWLTTNKILHINNNDVLPSY